MAIEFACSQPWGLEPGPRSVSQSKKSHALHFFTAAPVVMFHSHTASPFTVESRTVIVS
jgi:hypothetical protein